MLAEQLTTRLTLLDRATAALAYGRLGDAMGTPTENIEPEEIEQRFGWVDSYQGDGTDDTIMAQLIGQALMSTSGFATADDWAQACVDSRQVIFGDKFAKFFPSVIHAMSKLHWGSAPRRIALGNMPSSSSAMAIAPVGIVNAGNPRAAAAQAQEIASMLHVDEVAFCQDGAAAIASAISQAMGEAGSIDEVVASSTKYLKSWSGGEMIDLIEGACDIAREIGDYKSFRQRYHATYRKPISCDSRETVPAALALSLLAKGDPETVIIYGANFGRDTDTIACMAGYICGAYSGLKARAESRITLNDNVIEESAALAASLLAVGQQKASTEIGAWKLLAGSALS